MANTLRGPNRGQQPPAPAAKKPAPAPAADPAERIAARTEGLAGIMQLGMFASLVKGNMADVGAISMYAPKLCEEAAILGEKNEQFGRTLDFIAMAGPYTALLTAAVPFVLQLAANHNRLDPGLAAHFGVLSPAVLASKARKDLLEMELKAELERQQAEDALAAMQEEYMKGRANAQQREQQPAAA